MVSTASRPVQKVNSLINSGLSISNPIKPLNSPSTHSSSGIHFLVTSSNLCRTPTHLRTQSSRNIHSYRGVNCFALETSDYDWERSNLYFPHKRRIHKPRETYRSVQTPATPLHSFTKHIESFNCWDQKHQGVSSFLSLELIAFFVYCKLAFLSSPICQISL